MVTRTELLIATTNAGKVKEVRAVLADLPIALTGLADHPGLPEAVEDGDSFEANAAKKALHYARLTGSWTLADDSGLQVDALGGEPGIHSARFAGPDQDDRANNTRLIAELQAFPPEDWTARFRCAMALADPSTIIATATGAVEGRIVEQPAGDNGFGYDPHFLVAGHDMTAAQMPPELKNRISPPPPPPPPPRAGAPCHQARDRAAAHPACRRAMISADAL